MDEEKINEMLENLEDEERNCFIVADVKEDQLHVKIEGNPIAVISLIADIAHEAIAAVDSEARQAMKYSICQLIEEEAFKGGF